MAHSLRPHTLEAIGTYVSMLNECHYYIQCHYSGMVRF
jgi:hypothetical protein